MEEIGNTERRRNTGTIRADRAFLSTAVIAQQRARWGDKADCCNRNHHQGGPLKRPAERVLQFELGCPIAALPSSAAGRGEWR
jgi:hypothetical protein